MSIATPLCDALLDVIQESNNASQKSAQLWASNALRSISRTDLESYKKIINRTKQWLQTISRDVRPPSKRSEESEKYQERRFLTRIGFYENGNRTILGHQLTFVDDKSSSAVSKIPELLEGFPLVMAMPVFEIASLALAIRGSEAYWDGLKWICLLNDVDNDETVSALRKISEEMKCKIPEDGVNPQLPLRVASLLLWLSGNEDDEKTAPILNPPIDNFYDYEKDYLASPSTSLYGLERRHVEMVLCDISIPLFRKLDRTKKFFTDPNFIISEQFRLEISQSFKEYDVSKLDNSRHMTSENLRFKAEEVILARCAPDLLAELARIKMKGFKDRSQEERYGTAIHATHQLLLADQDSADGARALRFIGKESNDSDEAFAQSQFLLLEIKSLPVVEKITTLIEADLKYIFDFLAMVIEPLNKDDLHILVEKYSAGSKKQISDLILLITGAVTEAYSDDWDWMTSIAINKEFEQQGSVFQLLHAIDLLKFGNFLLKHRWSWHPDNNSNSNHFGSLALIAATVSLPFEQYASLIAPWLLPKAVTIRGGLSEEVKIATSILDSIIMNQMLELTDLGADIKVSLEERKKYPSALSISMRNNESDDLFFELQKSGSEDDRRENSQKIFDEALNRIKQKNPRVQDCTSKV